MIEHKNESKVDNTKIIEEDIDISRPLEWLTEEDWTYLSNYINKFDYTYYDDIYRVIQGNLSIKNFNNYWYKYNHTIIKDVNEALEIYNKEFPKLIAEAFRNIADDILKENIILKFKKSNGNN